MSTVNGWVYFKACHLPSITHKYRRVEEQVSLKSPCSCSSSCLARSPIKIARRRWRWWRWWRGGAVPVHRIPERIKHQTHSAAPLTIIKMPRLKGDIPNLRLFVSIKCIPRLLTHSHPPPSQEQCVKEGRVPRGNGNSIHFTKPTGPHYT